MRYFYTSLAARPMRLGGRDFKFMVTSLASGKASGIFETEDAQEIAILDDAVRGRRGVSEITAVQAEEAKKKARMTPSSVNTNASSLRSVQMPQLPALAVEAVTNAASAESAAANKKPVEHIPQSSGMPSIASLLQIRRVNPPKPFAGADAKTEKSAARATKAKVRVARDAVSGT